jgi:hypothetical protein
MMIDVIGCTAIIGCVVGVTTLISSRAERQRGTIPQLRQAIATTELQIRNLESSCEQERGEIDNRNQRLKEPGRLPQVMPIENYMQSLARMAEASNVRVLLEKPLASRKYPGLLEERFAYTITGPGTSIIDFLDAVENSGFWADISYLRIDTSSARKGQAVKDPVALLTFSLFSHLNEEESENG